MARRPPMEEWHKVTRNRNKSNLPKGYGHKERQITKFFMANLPDNCSRKEISEAFGGYGVIENIYIAKRRDALGQIFGFISFVNLYDGLDLQRKLSRVYIGGNKIKVNIARYAVENFDQRFAHLKRANKEVNFQPRGAQEKGSGRVGSGGTGGSTYLEKLLNVKGKDQGQMKSKKEVVIKVEDNVAAFSEFYGRAVVGKVIDFEVMRKLKTLMQEELWDGFEVVYIGGLYVMVIFEEEGRVSSFCKSEGVNSWFQEVEV